MIGSAEILAAFRELSNVKQLDRAELYGLLQDGIMAALAKKYGPNVQAEVDIDDGKGEIRIVLLKDVVDSVEDSSRQISVEDARSYDDGFQVGDVLEEPIDFAVFGQLTGRDSSGISRCVDLRSLIADHARAAGVRQLTISACCTRCNNDRFYSHRCGDAGRQIGVIFAESTTRTS